MQDFIIGFPEVCPIGVVWKGHLFLLIRRQKIAYIIMVSWKNVIKHLFKKESASGRANQSHLNCPYPQ